MVLFAALFSSLFCFLELSSKVAGSIFAAEEVHKAVLMKGGKTLQDSVLYK